jgi:hypothetical protein
VKVNDRQTRELEKLEKELEYFKRDILPKPVKQNKTIKKIIKKRK